MVDEKKDGILNLHGGEDPGTLSISPRFDVKSRKQLGEAFTPNVAEISKLIEQD